MRDFSAELRELSEWRDEKEAELERHFKEIGIPTMGLDCVSNSDEGMQIRREFYEKFNLLRQEYLEAKARGDEYMIDGKIHNAEQKTDDNQ